MRQCAGILTDESGLAVPTARFQGTADTNPADFLLRRMAEYDGEGRPRFVWNPQTIGVFQRQEGQLLPGFFHLDEVDRMPGTSQSGLLQAMEEQQVSVPDGTTLHLSFALVATANSRQFDPTARPIPTAVMSRFGAVGKVGYLTAEEDREILRRFATDSNLLAGNNGAAAQVRPPIVVPSRPPGEDLTVLRTLLAQKAPLAKISEQLLEGMVCAVKLTQGEIRGFTRFSKWVKRPCGPRRFLDLAAESAAQGMLAGRSSVAVEDVLAVGHRVFRAELEISPEAEIEGKSFDTLVSEILAEVFLGRTAAVSVPPR